MYHRKRTGYGTDYYPEHNKGEFHEKGYTFNDPSAIPHELLPDTEISLQHGQSQHDRVPRNPNTQ